MAFELPEYSPPDFASEVLRGAPVVKTSPVTEPGVAPRQYHATSIYPEYFKLPGTGWRLAEQSRMDCVAVVKDDGIKIKELRKLRPGEQVAVGRTEDGTEGVYIHTHGFAGRGGSDDKFAFRTGRSRETSFSADYDRLYELLRYERDHGYTVWVLGPAVVFDHDARSSLVGLIGAGYVDVILAGNALAAHDLEAALFHTALGQDIYTKAYSPQGHYHHLDAINRVRAAGSIDKFIDRENIDSGAIHASVKHGVPFVLAGSIRDDGPLPGVITDTAQAQDAMREHTRKATTVIGIATQLHAIAVGNMTPSYQVQDGSVRPVFFYVVDVSEFAARKLGDRGSLEVVPIITNAQDMLVNLARDLVS